MPTSFLPGEGRQRGCESGLLNTWGGTLIEAISLIPDSDGDPGKG